MLDLRVRSRVSSEYLESVKGHVLAVSDIDCLLTGSARVSKPDGSLLCIYLPKALPEDVSAAAYPILHTIRSKTTNRGLASGSVRAEPKRIGSTDPKRKRYRTYAKEVASNIIGVIEDTGAPEHRHCRLTAWTGRNLPQWQALQPYLQAMAQHFAEQVPERFAAQVRQVQATRPEWIVPNTPYTTVTINHSYPTGVHTDSGDLEEGFSCLACLRRGTYSGGFLTFPEYRIAVNMQDRDLLLMDAHEWHGNTQIFDRAGQPLDHTTDDAERISVVAYFRTAMVRCGSFAEEQAKSQRRTALKDASDGNNSSDVVRGTATAPPAES